MNEQSDSQRPSGREIMPDAEARRRLRRWRTVKDKAARGFVGMAGVGVVISLATIFFYLLSEVVPLFASAKVEEAVVYDMPGGDHSETLHIATERHLQAAVRFTADGRVIFFEPRTGEHIRTQVLDLPPGVSITSFATGEPRTGLVAFGLSDGTALVLQHKYEISYPDDQRHVEPVLEFPLGEAPIRVTETPMPVRQVAVQEGGAGFALVAETSDGELTYARYSARRNFMTGEVSLSREIHALPRPDYEVTRMLVDITLRNLLIGDAHDQRVR
jgi:phosphate transport system permease protein